MTPLLDLAAPFPESVGAVDLGSNSFHLVVARTTSGEPVVVSDASGVRHELVLRAFEGKAASAVSRG